MDYIRYESFIITVDPPKQSEVLKNKTQLAKNSEQSISQTIVEMLQNVNPTGANIQLEKVKM